MKKYLPNSSFILNFSREAHSEENHSKPLKCCTINARYYVSKKWGCASGSRGTHSSHGLSYRHERLELVDKLKHSKLFFVPLLFTSEDECMLKEARHVDLKHLTPLQWELLATCWRHNIEFFATDLAQWPSRLVAMFSYVLYYRWKHRKKVFTAITKALRNEQ